ncbi:MAG: hypothetical protein GF363_07040, partial [Chitinivibrionales bacterium]|nr:hypothetical protein [Chitinivibrionales bacterium]
MKERIHKRILPAAALLGPAILWVIVSGEPAVLTGLEIQAGKRGLALALEADRPFRAAVAAPRPTSSGAVVKITLYNTVYGLSEYSYNHFDRHSPVSGVTATDKPTGSVELAVELREEPEGPIRAKGKGKRVLALLSGRPRESLAWTAPGRKTPQEMHPQGSVSQGSAGRRDIGKITNIRILRRDRVEQLAVEMSRPLRVRARRRGRTIMLVIEDAVSGLSKKAFGPAGGSAFGRIFVRERERNGVKLVGVVICTNAPAEKKVLIRTMKQGLAIYMEDRTQRKMAFWSAETGKTLSYE